VKYHSFTFIESTQNQDFAQGRSQDFMWGGGCRFSKKWTFFTESPNGCHYKKKGFSLTKSGPLGKMWTLQTSPCPGYLGHKKVIG
jgi:hypothetical protein